jgi:hypothetical protein
MPPTMEPVPITFSTNESMRWRGFTSFFKPFCSVVIVGLFIFITLCIAFYTRPGIVSDVMYFHITLSILVKQFIRHIAAFKSIGAVQRPAAEISPRSARAYTFREAGGLQMRPGAQSTPELKDVRPYCCSLS